MYAEQTSPSSVINLSKTYGKITRGRRGSRAARNIYVLARTRVGVVERLEKYPDCRLHLANPYVRNTGRQAGSQLPRYLINNAR